MTRKGIPALEVLFDNEFVRILLEMSFSSFVGWMQLQPEAVELMAAFETVESLLRQRTVLPIRNLYQNGCQQPHA